MFRMTFDNSGLDPRCVAFAVAGKECKEVWGSVKVHFTDKGSLIFFRERHLLNSYVPSMLSRERICFRNNMKPAKRRALLRLLVGDSGLTFEVLHGLNHMGVL